MWKCGFVKYLHTKRVASSLYNYIHTHTHPTEKFTTTAKEVSDHVMSKPQEIA